MIKDQGLSSGKRPRRRADLVGQRFGRLTVEAFVGISYGNQATWHCVCVCGETRKATTSALNKGSAHACGVTCTAGAAIFATRVAGMALPPPPPLPHWAPLEGSDLGGWCKAERFMSGKPWSGRCPFQVKGGAA